MLLWNDVWAIKPQRKPVECKAQRQISITKLISRDGTDMVHITAVALCNLGLRLLIHAKIESSLT